MKTRQIYVGLGALLARILFQVALISFFMYAAIALLGGCSKEGEKEETTTEQSKPDEDKKTEVKNCTVIDTDEGAVVSCPDGSTVLIKDGNKGEDAPLCQIEVVQTCE